MVQEWVKEIVEKNSQCDFELDGKEYIRILEPEAEQEVFMIPEGELKPIKIVSGKYWGTHGVSNFWDWLEKDRNNNYTKRAYGYGGFYIEKENK